MLLASRALNVLLVSALANFWRKPEARVSLRHQVVMWFAGMRGAVSFALAITLPTATAQDASWSDRIVTWLQFAMQDVAMEDAADDVSMQDAASDVLEDFEDLFPPDADPSTDESDDIDFSSAFHDPQDIADAGVVAPHVEGPPVAGVAHEVQALPVAGGAPQVEAPPIAQAPKLLSS